MNKLLTVLLAGAFAFASASATADDRTTSNVTKAQQSQWNAERATRQAARADMTSDERAAAKRASNAEKQRELSQMPKGDATRTPLTMDERSRLKAERAEKKAANAGLTAAERAAAKKSSNSTKRNALAQQEKGQKGQ